MRNIVLKFPEIAYSLGTSFFAAANDSKLTISDHTEEITGITKIRDFWVTVSLDKSVKFFHIDWESKAIVKAHEILHKKKISSVCSNENFVFIGDKTGEVWKLNIEGLESGITDALSCSQFYIGHQATIELLWSDHRYLLSTDIEYKIKVSQIQEQGTIDYILLGHEKKIVSAVHFNGKFFSCDESGVLKCWNNYSCSASVKLNQPVILQRFGEHLLGVSADRTYVIDYIYMQVVPVKDMHTTLDYPHALHITQDSSQEVKIEFPIEA